MAKGEVDALDASGLDETAKSELLTFVEQSRTLAIRHAGMGEGLAVLALALDEHAVLKLFTLRARGGETRS